MTVPALPWLLLAAVSAASGSPGLTAPVGMAAAVQTLRQVQPGRVHFMVRGCDTDLAASLDGRSSTGIDEVDVVAVGGGSWYAVARLTDPAQALHAGISAGVLTVQAGPPSDPIVAEAPWTYSIEQLLSGALVPDPLPPPEGLRFLAGQALAPALDPLSYQPQLPIFAPAEGAGSWTAMDAARREYLEGTSPRARAEAAYALGWGYLKLGFLREAHYYIEQLPSFGSAFDPRVTAMTRMRVALLAGAWDEARARAADAVAAGAMPDQVLEALALISLATQNPPRSETALALLGVSARPESWLLAADLLQRDGRYAASVRVLAGLEARVPPQLAQVAALREGDALLATGDPVGAARAYEHAPEPIATVRRLHATLLQKKTTTWTQAIPELRRLARADDRGAAEALYLLSQIHRIFGENKSAMAVLNEIDTRFPAVFEDSEGTNELLAVYQSTLGPLVEQRRWVETAALHRETWSDRLMAASTDHRFLLPIADAFEALGLPEEARNVLRDAFYILNRREGDDPALVLRLAHLYADEGRQAEAMETLDYLASRDLPEAYRGQRAMLLGQVLASMGQDAEAKKAYASAALHPETRDEAQIRLALMDAAAGRCQDAIPSLQRLLLPERMLAHRTDPLPFLALARCLMSEGRESEAARVAREAAGRIDSPDDARAAGYMAFDPAGAEGEAAAMQREALLAEPDIWARLGLEDIENERFKEQVAARRGSLSAP